MPNLNHSHGISELLQQVFKNDNWNDAVARRFQHFYLEYVSATTSFNADILLKDIDTNSTERELDVFKRWWGFKQDQETLAAIAVDYKISRERVRQIKGKLTRKLKHPSKRNILRNNLEQMGFFF